MRGEFEIGPEQRPEVFGRETGTIYPIQLVQVRGGGSLPAPLARISACGMLTIDLLQDVVSVDPPRGRYVTLSTSTLQGRGVNSAISLLKLLVSRPHRFASKDWLVEQMRRSASPDEEEEEGGPGIGRLDNVASLLRTLLVSVLQPREDLEQVRLLLLSFLRTGRESGPGYQLAAYPLIWLDTDAIAWNVERGALLDSFGDEHALPLWERAYELVSRGAYLIDERYSDWAQEPRQQMQGYLRQCVRVLTRRYLSLFGERGEERAILLLRTYVLEHPTEEDALRPLMELLGKRECFQEALDYYQRLCELLEEEGREPDPRTKKIGLYVQTRKLQRERTAASNGNGSPFPAVSPSSRLPQGTTISHPLPQGWNNALQTQPPMQSLNGAEVWSDEQALGMWLALAAHYLTPFFDQRWSTNALAETLEHLLPIVKVMRKITGFELSSRDAANSNSRTSFSVTRHISEEECAQLCQAFSESIIAGWRRVQTGGSHQILAISKAQLYLLQQFTSRIYPSIRPTLYSGVYRLIGAALHFQGRYGEAYKEHEKAYYTALESADVWNMAQCRAWQADGLKEQKQYEESLQTTDAALRLISMHTGIEIIRTKAHLLASSAETAALLGDEREVQSRLEASANLLTDISEPHEEFDQTCWHQIAGVCALVLGQNKMAVRELQKALNELPTQWSLRYATTLIPLTIAYARMKEKELCLEHAERSKK